MMQTTRTLSASTVALDVVAMADAELACAIEAARAAVNAPTLLAKLLEEQQRRAEERRVDLAEYDELIERWVSRLPAMEAAYYSQLDALSSRSGQDAIQAAYVLGRARYSLQHDLSAVDAVRFKRVQYAVANDLSLAAGAAADQFLLSIRHRPPKVDQPWKNDLRRADQLVQKLGLKPEPRIGNGG